MIASYWNPKENYNTYSAIGLLVADKNRVVQHPYDSLGLINENYATCEGMARSLVELYKYFGINAVLARLERTSENGYIETTLSMNEDKLSMRKAIKVCFEGSILDGCFFHFTKAIWAKIKKLHLFKKNSNK